MDISRSADTNTILTEAFKLILEDRSDILPEDQHRLAIIE
jgi:hypothetical protein